MKLIINNIKVAINDEADLKGIAAKKLGIGKGDILSFRIAKESIDARRKPGIVLVYSAVAEVNGEYKPKNDDIRVVETEKQEAVVPGSIRLSSRPLVVGSGPSGLFAGLVLAQYGYKPLIIERGNSAFSSSYYLNMFRHS